MAVDTMCSSSLTALHLGCQDLKLGKIDLAIAGGVNVTIHPNKYRMLSASQFISSRGHCESFGEGGEGYIPGEGVGVVLLKRLAEAQQDQDRIYGVIKGSAVNHGGKTNGYTVPNPNAQHSVIRSALKEAKIDPRTISYIEAHGTGTKLGDPIEISGLTKAFGGSHTDDAFCWIGSVKSNIGHGESAAGIAGVTKVLLQMQHGQIVPSLHSRVLNPHIDFSSTPFTVNQELRDWRRPVIDGEFLPRSAGISSFGAGGSNAHVIIEEYHDEPKSRRVEESTGGKESYLIVLSAKNQDSLNAQAKNLYDFLLSHSDSASENLPDLAYTLQVGREAMDERVGLIINSQEGLEGKLKDFLDGKEHIEDLYRGQVKQSKDTLAVFTADEDLQRTIDTWIRKGKYHKLLGLWVKGLIVDWNKLYGANKPQRMSLPTYPFAKERYWINGISDLRYQISDLKNQLHPLVHENTSDLSEQPYSFDWNKLYGANKPQRMSLPTYPFAKERYWINGISDLRFQISDLKNQLHPLVHENTSDLCEQRFSSTFTGEEFFLKDHQIKGQTVLPGVALLEMAREAVKQASGWDPERSQRIRLKNVVWARPIAVGNDPQEVHIGLFPEENGEIAYEIYTANPEDWKSENRSSKSEKKSTDQPSKYDINEGRSNIVPEQNSPRVYPDGRRVHSQGIATFSSSDRIPPVDLTALQSACTQSRLSSEKCYETYQAMSIDYGPAHQSLEDIYVGVNEVLAKLTLPSSVVETKDLFTLHPSLLDSALQASIGIGPGKEMQIGVLPFSLEHLEILGRCTRSMWGWVRYSAPSTELRTRDSTLSDGTQKFDIDLCDEDGMVCVRMKAFSFHTLDRVTNDPPSNLCASVTMPLNIIHQCQLPTLDETETIFGTSSKAIPKRRLIALRKDKLFSGRPTPEKGSVVVPLVSISTSMPKPKRRTVPISTPKYSKEILEQELRSSLADTLYVKQYDIDPNEPFTDIGMDSIIGTEWVRAINKHYVLRIPVSKVYDYPTIKGICGISGEDHRRIKKSGYGESTYRN